MLPDKHVLVLVLVESCPRYGASWDCRGHRALLGGVPIVRVINRSAELLLNLLHFLNLGGLHDNKVAV